MHVFTYGSLMFPDVWQRVVRGSYRSAPAVVAGHARFAVSGETYPAMVARPGGRVSGVVYFDVVQEDIAALDAFEGADYRRDIVQATLESGQTVAAGSYIFRDQARLAADDWHPERFELQRFLQAYCGFVPGG